MRQRASVGDGFRWRGAARVRHHALWLKAYEGYLLHKGGKGLAWNTVSTYMRMLQAVYNRAVVRKLAAFIPHQFRDVFTGRKADHRRVLDRDDMQSYCWTGILTSLPPAWHGHARAWN